MVLILWKLSSSSTVTTTNTVGAEKRTATPPLRLEKLTGTGQSGLVAISPDGKFLAYTQSINKESGIWLRHLATNTNVEIAPPTGPVYGLAFANSGEYIFFTKGRPTALYRISLHGGVPTKIVGDLEGKFSISSDDSQVAFVRRIEKPSGTLRRSLVIAGSDGTGERTLLVATHPERVDAPVWSPDGQAILCSYGNEAAGLDTRLVQVSVVDGAKKELGSERFFRITKMAWLPDKSGLIICARQLEESSQLWLVSYPNVKITQITQGLSSYLDLSIAANSDSAIASQATRISDIWVGPGGEPRKLKKITQAIDDFCWTPNGRLIYSSTASGNRDLWIMQPDGTGQKQLTNDPAVDGTPAVTLDGRYVVFMSNRTGSFQVWRTNIDGSNQIQLTTGPAKNFPSVSPDGKWVFYNSTDDWHSWRTSIEGRESVRLTDYRASYPSPSPDGRLVACVGRAESKPQLLIVAWEGGAPVKRIDLVGVSFSGTRVLWSADGKALTYAAGQNGAITILKQTLSGGVPQKLADFGEDDLLDFGYSFDGKLMALTRGVWQHDIVLISDLSAVQTPAPR